MDRKKVLAALLTFSRPISELKDLVEDLPWDTRDPEATLKPDHIRIVLERFSAAELGAADVEAWADLIEMRDDIEYQIDCEDMIADALFVLATPAINGPLDGSLVAELMDLLSD